MKKDAIVITLESVAHDEFVEVAAEVSKQLRAGNKVVLEVAEKVSETSVRSLLIGRYLPANIVTKLVIRKQS